MLQGKVSEEKLRSCCAELERRLRSGEPCRAEDIFGDCPGLADSADTALDLIYTEYLIRSEVGPAPALEEYYRRFPQWREPLDHQFQIHALLDSQLPGRAGQHAAASHPDDGATHHPWPSCPDDFEILQEIARGGMGVVYKAWQKHLKRVVALKIILARSLASLEQRARFRIEAAAIGRLLHPNIVQIFRSQEWENSPFLVLEYVAGGTLAKRWNGAPQDPAAVAALTETLARAVDYAHQRGVVHRDLRPGNVLLARDGTPKIIDFGLAKVTLADEDVTLPGQIVGTPSYMAPEQADGLNKDIGPLVDVYALGAMLYEGLTGRPPFRGHTILDTLREVGFSEPEPPRQLRPDVPRDLETICLKCLQKEQQRRYGSAADLAEDLHRFLAHESIHARPVLAAERLWRWCRRNALVAGLSLALAVVLVTSVTLLTWTWRQTMDARADADAARRQAERSAINLLLHQAVGQADQGDVDHALQLFQQCLERAIRIDDAELERVARSNLATFRTD